MQRLGEIWRRVMAAARWRQLDRDLEEEMRFHLEMKTRDHRDAGLGADQARRAAQQRFGHTTLLQEESREARGWGAVERLGQDLKYAVRMLAKNRGFTAVA